MLERPIRIDLVGAPSTEGAALLIERTLVGRAGRAAGVWAGCWIAAAISIFIPLFHFILVPTLLLLGPLLGVLRLREDITLAGVRGTCPRCAVERHFSTSGRFKDGRGVHCDGCGSTLRIRARHMSDAAVDTAP
jgi:hypothetical protein